MLPQPDLSIACNHQCVCLHWPGASFCFCLSDESEVMPCQPDPSIAGVDDCIDQVCHSDFFCHRCYFWPEWPDLVSVATLGQIYQSCCEWLSPSSIAIIGTVNSSNKALFFCQIPYGTIATGVPDMFDQVTSHCFFLSCFSHDSQHWTWWLHTQLCLHISLIKSFGSQIKQRRSWLGLHIE